MLTRQSMPKDLPYFTGDPTEWPNFIYQYQNTTAICGFTNEENLCRLQKCLKGYARNIVESLLIMPQNVRKVIDTLQSRFGRPEHIIMMLLEKIKNFPAVREDKLDMLINFSDQINNFVGTIEALNQHDHLQNPILLQELLNKLPTNHKLNWIEHISSKPLQNYKILEFSLWLNHKASIACQIQLPKLTTDFSNSGYKGKGGQQKGITLATGLVPSEKKCICCNGGVHHLSTCFKFKSMNNDERWHFVSTNKICFSCLMPNHITKKCRKIKKCGINGCTKPHHVFLHKDEVKFIEDNKNISSENHINKDLTEINCHITGNKNVLLKILPVVISKGKRYVQTFALLDDASTVTLIDEDLAVQLDLDGPKHSLCIQWTNNQVNQQTDSRVVSCNVQSRVNGNNFQIRHARTIKGLSLPTQTVNMEEIVSKYPYIGDRVSTMVRAKPLLLIGQDNWPLLINRKVVTGPWNGPALSKTLLGWVIHGNVSTGSTVNLSNRFVCHVSHGEKDDLDILHDLVKQQWQIDNYGLDKVNKSLSKDDVKAKEILDNTMRRIGEKFETGLLWKNDQIVFPESYSNAMKRLLCTEKKMDKISQFGQSYCTKMLDLENKGYIKKTSKYGSNKRKCKNLVFTSFWHNKSK